MVGTIRHVCRRDQAQVRMNECKYVDVCMYVLFLASPVKVYAHPQYRCNQAYVRVTWTVYMHVFHGVQVGPDDLFVCHFCVCARVLS
jgi:hypothetical protein